jgi:glycerophosphoryl diester phosphodiesterase
MQRLLPLAVLSITFNSKMISAKVNDHTQVIGHRGARGLFPENTIDGFINTVKLGIRVLELDVVITNDSQVVVSHEPWMHHKFCSEPGGARVKMKQQHNIYKMDLAQVKQFDCGKRGNRDFPGQQPSPSHKPLLDEVFTAVDDFTRQNELQPVEYIVEIKSNELTDELFHPGPARYAQLVHQALQKANINERIIVKSFDVRPLQELHKLDPSLRIGLLIANTGSVERNISKLGFVPYTYNPSHRLVKEKIVKDAHRKGMKVMVWTVNDAEEMKTLSAMGVDGIITDYPDVALKVLNK